MVVSRFQLNSKNMCIQEILKPRRLVFDGQDAVEICSDNSFQIQDLEAWRSFVDIIYTDSSFMTKDCQFRNNIRSRSLIFKKRVISTDPNLWNFLDEERISDSKYGIGHYSLPLELDEI